MFQRSAVPLLFLLMWGIVLAACSVNEEAQVEKVLEARRLGLEKKDITLYMSSISPRYLEKGGDGDQLRREAMEMMRGFDSIEMRIISRQILVSQNRAEAIQSYEIRIYKGGQVSELKGKERIGLEKEGEGWKIVSGL